MQDSRLNHYIKGLKRHQKVLNNGRQYQTLHFAVKRLMNFIQSSILLKGLVDEMKSKCNAEAVRKAAHILIGSDEGHRSDEFEREEEFILRSYFVLEICARGSTGIEHKAAEALCREPSNEEERYEKIKSVLVDPLVDYLVDELDEQKYILSSLSKYKQKIEWFNKTRLQEVIKRKKRKHKTINKIENILNIGVYEYLHDQGVEFYLETISVESRGRVDLIGAQGSGPHLLVDGKYLDKPNQVKSQLHDAFWQVFNYTKQYNRQFGYVICFSNIERNIRFDFPKLDYSTPAIAQEEKTIFFILIDIFYNGSTPSQKKTSEDVVVSINDLIRR